MPRLIRTALESAGIGGLHRAASGVDVIGDIAVVRLEGFSVREKRKIAKALLGEMKNVAVVMEQEGAVEGEYRLRKLLHLAGEKRTLTTHRENGCAFKVDVARCYFSPRLSTERLTVARAVRKKERVLNMFAGVGPYSIPIAKLAGAKVVSCEINEVAARLHEENDRINKVEDLVTVICGDAAELPSMTRLKFDRVLMPLPQEADRFFPAALSMAKKGGVIHYYRHLLGVDEEEASGGLRQELAGLLPRSAKYSIRKVRDVGPRWLELVAEIRA